MEIKVLGTGCAKCKSTVALIDEVAKAKGVAISLEKVEDIQAIVGYGVMGTPAVVINGKVIHAGGIPGRAKVEEWLSSAAAAPCCDASSDCCKPGASNACCDQNQKADVTRKCC